MEALLIATDALRSHKLRSFLTLLGVIIGVMTVVVVVSIITGLNRYVAEKIFQLSPDVFIVSRFGIITSRDEFLEALKRPEIARADAEAVERLCRGCGLVGVEVQNSVPVKRGSERLSGVTVHGSTANFAVLNNLDLEAGRFFTAVEDRHSAQVVVIGSDVREELFDRLDPIGRRLWVAGAPMKVVGLLRKQGSVLGQSQDNQLYMPLGAFLKQFGARQSLNLYVRPSAGIGALAETEDEVRVILRSRRHTAFRAADPFGIVTAEAAQSVWRGISAGAFALMVVISGISLVVGGVVIMNIMLVSVVERTREIGVRLAVGARVKDIRRQFLVEAVLLALVGGTVGVLLGALIAVVVSRFFPTRITAELVVAGLLLAVVTGAAAGALPARRASRLPPVEALGYE